MKQSILIATIIIIAFASCDKENINTEFNSSDYWNAHHSQTWDSTSTSNNLIGTWTWVYNYCCPEASAQEGRRTETENFKVKFDRSTIEVIKNGKIVQTTSWSVHLKDGGLYGLQMNSPVSQLYGSILFSDNSVLFINSYIDGEDNYFQRELSTD